MCGIAGMVSSKGIELRDLETMSLSLRHRGPDGYGFMFYSHRFGIRLFLNQDFDKNEYGQQLLGFAHCRLSILDLSKINFQPMVDPSGKYCLIYNGEIYNYQELRTELEKLGYSFKTTGDTEVLLYAYQAWGLSCLERLNGMWAFALFNSHTRQVLFSRDRFGIKPLYYTVRNNTLYFASEIKALLAVSSMRCEPNEKVVANFLLTGQSDETSETFFEGIYQFQPSHYTSVSVDDEKLNINQHSYWSFPEEVSKEYEKEGIDQFRELFLDSVRLHTHSDVPVGTCLSGGLDSSSIVCAADLLRKRQKIPNYTHSAFGYISNDEAYNEKRFMEIVASKTGASMYYVNLNDEQFYANLPRILWTQDEPFGSASIAAQWFVFKSAKAEGMKVMLDGQGADETLAGYHSYLLHIAMRKLSTGNLIGFKAFKSQYQREIGPFPICGRNVLQIFLQKLFPFLITINRYLPKSICRISLSGALSQSLTRLIPMDTQIKNLRVNSLHYKLKQDFTTYVLPTLLRYEDRNSMAHSIEARVPFLDYRLVEFLFKLPEEWKIRGVTTKYILREAMQGILPEAIRTRKDKIGFKASSDFTFSYVQRNEEKLVRNENEFEYRWFKPEGVEQLFRQSDHSVNAEFEVWRIVNTKLWTRQFWGKTALKDLESHRN
jgi:asparagine synthase (glutamine-hydrolysing)